MDHHPFSPKATWQARIASLTGSKAAGLLILLPLPAPALVTGGGAAATAVNADLSIAGLVSLQTGNLGGISGTSPPAFTLTSEALPVSAGAGVLDIDLAAISGVGNTAASSTVNGMPGPQTSAAAGGVVGLDMAVADLPQVVVVNPPPLLGISADAIGTSCSVSGDSGQLTASADFTLTNLVVRIGGAPVNLNLPAIIGPNTSVDLDALGLAGVVLHLNERTVTGNGTGTRAVAAVALRVEISALAAAGIGAVNGDVIIGASSAALTADADSDGAPDGVDLDSDNDGVPDAAENAEALNGGDTDSDGVPDFLDQDSDNDGIYDVNEAGHSAADSNNDGRIDGAPAAFGPNGLANVLETSPESGVISYTPADTDGDSREDRVDLDSDNDSISDLRESGDGSLSNTDHDGLVDGVPGTGGVIPGAGALDPADTDGDGTPDFKDPDRRNDGVPDITDNGFGSLDGNGDGVIDSPADSDQDGIPDVFDSQPGALGGFPVPEGFPDWDDAHPAADTDGDVFARDQEYAFGGLPAAGTHRVEGTTRRQGLTVVRRGIPTAGVDVSFVRPKGRYDAVYTLLGSASLDPAEAVWIPVAVNPSITDNGDSTETLTWADAGTLAPLTQDQGFVRLKVETPASPAGSHTLVEGWNRLTISGKQQTYGVNFTSLPVLTGIIGSVSGSIVNVPASAGGEDLSAYLNEPGAAYYLEITDGAFEGHRFDLAGGGVASVTVNPGGAGGTAAVPPADWPAATSSSAGTTRSGKCSRPPSGHPPPASAVPTRFSSTLIPDMMFTSTSPAADG